MMYSNKIYEYLTGTILVLIAIFLLSKMNYLLIPFKVIMDTLFLAIIIGVLFYYILRPLVKFLERKKINSNIAVLLAFLILLSVLAFIFIKARASLRNEFSDFFSNMAKQIEVAKRDTDIIEEKFYHIIPIKNIQQKLITSSQTIVKNVMGNTGKFISSLANIGNQIILIPFILFYLLRDDTIFAKNFLKIIPQKHREDIKGLLRNIDKTLSIYITGQLIVSTAIGILTYIGYKIIGIESAFILAVFSMITSIIPILGVFIGVLPAVLIALSGGISMVIKVLVVLFVVQQLEGNFISPHVIGNRLNIHPLVVIFVVIMFISLLGFIGGFLAIPTYAVLKVVIKDTLKIMRRNRLK
ncbi:AI-2E family transporter [Clostridium aestuarii]|uniref:AI-2E family transporter n=1 Tax=Clostridium aestuarii TaxID=338193 RepID=A0ABT4CZ80_9CLOT|nr:AI-2E family transporter [Clostridium aestuarii]MCY6484294.1 AI-2E family transporter [Clostridium aestuarii]